jgi:hypothetical protein
MSGALDRLQRHLPPELLDDLAVVDVGSGRLVAMSGDVVIEAHMSGAVATRPIGGGMFEEASWQDGQVIARRNFYAGDVAGGLSPDERAERKHRSKPRKRNGPPAGAARSVPRTRPNDDDSTRAR